MNVVKEFTRMIDKHYINDKEFDKDNQEPFWEKVSSDSTISDEFIKRYKDKLNKLKVDIFGKCVNGFYHNFSDEEKELFDRIVDEAHQQDPDSRYFRKTMVEFVYHRGMELYSNRNITDEEIEMFNKIFKCDYDGYVEHIEAVDGPVIKWFGE